MKIVGLMIALLTGVMLSAATVHAGEKQTRALWAAFTLAPTETDSSRILIGKCSGKAIDQLTNDSSPPQFIEITASDTMTTTNGTPPVVDLRNRYKTIMDEGKRSNTQSASHATIYIRTKDIVQITALNEMLTLE